MYIVNNGSSAYLIVNHFDRKELIMKENEKKELMNTYTDLALSATGTLVGLAIGGPVGAIAGGVLSPSVKLATKVYSIWIERRKERMTSIVDNAISKSNKTENEILEEMASNPEWCDKIMAMIRKIADNDPSLDALFSELLSLAIKTNDTDEQNRLIVLSSSITDLNQVQLIIVKHLYLADGVLSAHDISEKVNVPELELRNAVRDLELRGIIADNGKEPTIWSLRELGVVLAKTITAIEIDIV